MTPGELTKIKAAVAEAAAALLAREGNENLTAEDLAEELAQGATEALVASYEAIQEKSYNLVVVGHFTTADGKPYMAAVGPLSTRATARARGLGERFAWDYRSRTGSGKYALVPLVRNPAEAWDQTRADKAPKAKADRKGVIPGIEPSYEPNNFEMSAEALASISAEWEIDPDLLARKFGPACLCGLPDHPRYNGLGDPADMTCPRHGPKESDEPGA